MPMTRNDHDKRIRFVLEQTYKHNLWTEEATMTEKRTMRIDNFHGICKGDVATVRYKGEYFTGSVRAEDLTHYVGPIRVTQENFVYAERELKQLPTEHGSAIFIKKAVLPHNLVVIQDSYALLAGNRWIATTYKDTFHIKPEEIVSWYEVDISSSKHRGPRHS